MINAEHLKYGSQVVIVNDARNNDKQVMLWGVRISPYVRKVMVALAEKNICFKQIEILPKILLQATHQTVPEEFNKISPLGKIPVLQIGNFAISDSTAIISYIDKKFNFPTQLYPLSPEKHAKVIWFERYSDEVMSSVIYKKIFFEIVIKPKALNMLPDYVLVNEAISNELPQIFNYLNHILILSKWIIGDDFTSADIAIGVQLLALSMSNFNISQHKWPNLYNYFNNIIKRPSFQNIIND